MKPCPFCGAKISNDAAFCPHCATSLIEKTVLKPYRTFPLRSAFAFLIPALLLGGVLLLLFQKNNRPSPVPDSPESSVSASDVPKSSGFVSDIPESSDSVSDVHPTDDAGRLTGGSTNISSRPQSNLIKGPATKDTSLIGPGFGDDTDESTKNKSSSTQGTSDQPSQSTTDTAAEPATDDTPEETYTPLTAPLSGTYTYRGVEWYYETPATNPNETKYPYETRELAYITGVNSLAEDGIYYVPETVHGKHVIFLQMSEYSKAHYNFESTLFKESVKQIYFPPSAYGITTAFLTQNTTLTDVFIAGEDFFLNLYYAKGNLTVHSSETCVYTASTKRPLMKDKCTTISDENKTVQWEEWDPSTVYPQS